MLTLIIASVVLSLLAGLTVKRVTDWRGNVDGEITWQELLAGGVICAVIVTPLVIWIGWIIALNSMVSYKEFWNGWEVSTRIDEQECYRDGSCTYTYDCDPYTVTRTSTDMDGNVTTYTETEYHSCPYADAEYRYFVDTTLGEYQIGGVRFAEDAKRYRVTKGLPSNVGRGAPERWIEADERIEADDPGPVTQINDYDNFLLASQTTILAQYSDSIERYLDDGLLPKVVDEVRNEYEASKLYVRGGVSLPGGADVWQENLARLNAALGSDLQGDLHVVVVPAEVEADNYSLSLQAYWGSPDLGDHALSKNGIVLVIGSDGTAVEWARTFTGMPVGNEQVLNALESEVKGKPMIAASLLGRMTATISRGDAESNVDVECEEGSCETLGVVPDVLWGRTGGVAFERICMSCGDEGEGVGYLYLRDELQPGTGMRVLLGGVAFFLSGILWVLALVLDIHPGREGRDRLGRSPSLRAHRTRRPWERW